MIFCITDTECGPPSSVNISNKHFLSHSLLIYCMQQSASWAANRFTASQDIPRVLWNQKVHYRSHKCPPPDPIFRASSKQSIPPHRTSWRSILILSSYLRLGLPSALFPSGFPTKTLCTPLLSSIRTTYPAHLIVLDFITRTIFGERYRSLNFSFHYPKHKK